MSEFKPYCPYCGSTNIKITIAGYGEKAVGYAAVVAGHVAGGTVGRIFGNMYVGNYLQDAIVGGTPTQYKCKRCGKTFHTSKYNAWYGGDEKYKKGINKKRNE